MLIETQLLFKHYGVRYRILAGEVLTDIRRGFPVDHGPVLEQSDLIGRSRGDYGSRKILSSQGWKEKSRIT